MRLSNGSFNVQANATGDIRAFAVKVQGVSGPSSLGGAADHQDFLFINHESFAARTSDEFVEVAAAGPVAYDVALQFFVDEAATPIENPTVAWPESQSPFVTVARLTLASAEADVEGMRFDPWGGLADHRPLGEIMRARKSAYCLSQKGRGAA